MLLDENLFETQGSRLSFREFVDYLNSIGNGYHNFSRVKGDNGSGYRYTLSKPLTDEQKDYLSKYSNVDFGTAQYKYAPEIKYSTVILLDRMNKVEEDIVKTKSGKWANKGKEGTHGEFKTKKAAREQQKAMFARGFKEDMSDKDEVKAIRKDMTKLGMKPRKSAKEMTDFLTKLKEKRKGTLKEDVSNSLRNDLDNLGTLNDIYIENDSETNLTIVSFNYNPELNRRDVRNSVDKIFKKYNLKNIDMPEWSSEGYYYFVLGDVSTPTDIDGTLDKKELKEDIDYTKEDYLFKPYWYFTLHGVTPGSLPKYVNVWGSFETPNGTYFATSDVINSNDLQEFEIKEQKPNVEDIPENVRISIQKFLEKPLTTADKKVAMTESVLQDIQSEHERIRKEYGQEVYDALDEYIDLGNDLSKVLFNESEWNKFKDWLKDTKNITLSITESKKDSSKPDLEYWKKIKNTIESQMASAKKNMEENSDNPKLADGYKKIVKSYEDMLPELNDRIKSLSESFEDEHLGTETNISQENLSDTGLSTMVNALISDELEAIDGYNSAIVTFETEGKSDYTNIMRDIINEEQTHIGQLQKILDELKAGTIQNIKDGQIEAGEQLAETETPIDENVELNKKIEENSDNNYKSVVIKDQSRDAEYYFNLVDISLSETDLNGYIKYCITDSGFDSNHFQELVDCERINDDNDLVRPIFIYTLYNKYYR